MTYRKWLLEDRQADGERDLTLPFKLKGYNRRLTGDRRSTWMVLMRRFLWLMWDVSTLPSMSGSTMTSPSKFTEQYVQQWALWPAHCSCTELIILSRQSALISLFSPIFGSRSYSKQLWKVSVPKSHSAQIPFNSMWCQIMFYVLRFELWYKKV